MLGGTFEDFTQGRRSGYNVYWRTNGDEPAAKWRDYDRSPYESSGKWYNGVLDGYNTLDTQAITSITCNNKPPPRPKPIKDK